MCVRSPAKNREVDLTETGFDLARAMKAHPLPEDIEDTELNRSQLALAMDVSDNTITKWLTRGMPCVTPGGNGRDYVFSLAECYAWRREIEEADRASRNKADEAARQMALLFRNEDDDGAAGGEQEFLTARQRIEESEAAYKEMRAAELRGDLVRVHRVRDLFEDVLVQMRTQVVALVDYAEIEFGLTPDQVEAMQRRCDETLVSARHDLSNLIEERQVSVMAMANRNDGAG